VHTTDYSGAITILCDLVIESMITLSNLGMWLVH